MGALLAREDAVLMAVQCIHEAAFSPDGWARALEAVAIAAGSQQSIFLAQDALTGAVEFVAGFGVASEHLAACAAAARARSFSQWMQNVVAPASFADKYPRPIRDNKATRQELSYAGVIVSPLRTQQRDVYLSVSRCLGRAKYDPGDETTVRTLTPHLAAALNVANKLAAADLFAMGAAVALDRLGAGVLLVDAAATVVSASETAEAILSGKKALEIDRKGLRTRDPSATRVLRRMIASCADLTVLRNAPGGSLEIVDSDGRGALHVIVAPLRTEFAYTNTLRPSKARPVAAIIVTDPAKERDLRRENLRHRFGLTFAESNVAFEIVKGDGREACAARLGVSANTIRAHLSSIFEKTGVHRQAELVRLVIAGGART